MASPKRTPRKAHSKTKAAALEREGRVDARDAALGEIMVKLASDPMADVEKIAREYGYSEAHIRGMLAELRRKVLPVKMAIRKVTNQVMTDKADTIIDMGLERLAEVLPFASPRDVAYAMDRAFNMRQLLKGEPTSILTVDDRKTLNELMPMLIRESRRRGIIIDANAVVVAEMAPAGASLPAPEKVIEGERIQ